MMFFTCRPAYKFFEHNAHFGVPYLFADNVLTLKDKCMKATIQLEPLAVALSLSASKSIKTTTKGVHLESQKSTFAFYVFLFQLHSLKAFLSCRLLFLKTKIRFMSFLRWTTGEPFEQ